MGNTRRLLSDATVTTALDTVSQAIAAQLGNKAEASFTELADLFSARQELINLAARNGNGSPAKLASDKPKKERAKGRIMATTDPQSSISGEV